MPAETSTSATEHSTPFHEGINRQYTRSAGVVRELHARLPAEKVSYDLNRVRIAVSPRWLGTWIEVVAGLSILVGGMKLPSIPVLSVLLLLIGVALLAKATWDWISDSNYLVMADIERRYSRRSAQH